jgi:hypothetical protein
MRTKTRILLPVGALAAIILAACTVPPPTKPPVKPPPTTKPPVTTVAPPTATSCPAVGANATPGPDSINPIAGTSGVDGVANATVVIGNVVYVGGAFTHAVLPNGTVAAARLNLAAFCLANGKLLTTFVANTSGPVNALATDGTNLFVGGNFTTINGQPAARDKNGAAKNTVVKVDARTGARIAAFNAPAMPYFLKVSSGVLSMAYFGGNLYVGGDFGSIGSTSPALAVGNAAAFNSTNGAYTGWHAATDGPVSAVAVDANSVWVGGKFTTAAGVAHDDLAKLSRSSGADTGVSYGAVGARPSSIAVNTANESIFVGLGLSTGVNQGTGRRITYFDPSGTPNWSDANPKGEVQAVSLIGSRVFAGMLTGYASPGPGTNPAVRLAGIDFTKQPGSVGYLAWTPSVAGGAGVYGIATAGNRMVAVGNFTGLGSIGSLHGLAIFN